MSQVVRLTDLEENSKERQITVWVMVPDFLCRSRAS